MDILTDPTPNLPLLRKILDHIDAHPEEWRQGTWWGGTSEPNQCGTTHCIAGHAVAMTEGVTEDGWPTSGREWPDAAQDVLGLTGSYWDDKGTPEGGEAADLFDPENTREDVQVVAERIAARAGEVL